MICPNIAGIAVAGVPQDYQNQKDAEHGYLVYLKYRLEKLGKEIWQEEALSGNYQEAQYLKDDYEVLLNRIKDIENG